MREGPSPRVRGKLSFSRWGLELCGSIPACAGETRWHPGCCGRPEVHPRVCGGNRVVRRCRGLWSGPSPRVRGKRRSSVVAAAYGGSIPACAGKTRFSWGVVMVSPVHPRVCGGNIPSSVYSANLEGPSPRVRGKPMAGIGRRMVRGSIPACAGETANHHDDARQLPVHPRVCGGNRTRRKEYKRRYGPSPRVRGKPPYERLPESNMRSIPACAGETHSQISMRVSIWVHPRVCGGNACSCRLVFRYTGPSPRVRGKRVRTPADRLPRWSIPACAGETRSSPPQAGHGPVHPRVCGGNAES